MGASLLTDRLLWGRERTDRWLNERREVYVAYLAALHAANQALRASSLADQPRDQPRELHARAVFREAGVVQARENIVLVEPVARAAEDACQSLRALRDGISQGQDLGEYKPPFLVYEDHLPSLRDAMRKDPQVIGPSIKIQL